jgi:serine/threonine-protein kinase
MKKLPFVFVGLSVVAVVGGLTLLGRDNVRAAPSLAGPDYPIGTARVEVPAGSFLMGSEAGAVDERPVHRVSGSAFVMDRYEVTNARYAACVQAGDCSEPALASSFTRPAYFGAADYNDYPVIHVSWGQAASFCAWAGGRLPTEAEWERAARGTADSRTYPWGDSAPDCTKANLAGCVGDTDRVGRRPAGQSPYGVFDMAGNVWEWTADWYEAGFYSRSPSQDPTGPDMGHLKVMRGGCWVSGGSSLRATCRKAELPSLWAPNVGFRCIYAADARGTRGQGDQP